MKKRSPDKTPPVSPPDYGRSLRGLGFNLLVWGHVVYGLWGIWFR